MDDGFSSSNKASTSGYQTKESTFTYDSQYSSCSRYPPSSFDEHNFLDDGPVRCRAKSPSTQSLIDDVAFMYDGAPRSEMQILGEGDPELFGKEKLKNMRRQRRKSFFDRKHTEYRNNFTVHGLTKSFCSASIEERAFWITLILFGSFICLFILRGLISKYLRYEIYTQIHFEITNTHYYPSVTFCEEQLLFDAYFAYCGVASRFQHPRQNETCGDRVDYRKANISSGSGFWSNGYFNVTLCNREQKICFRAEHFRSVTELNNSCITWNFDGNLKDEHNQPDIKFRFNPPSYFNRTPRIMVIPHSPNLTEIDVTAKIDLDPFKDYTIKLDKTVIKRLPAPYPSNCTRVKLGDIFPGRYSRHGCIESNNHIDMFKNCGDTIDHTYRHISDEIKLKHRKNKTIRETLDCIGEFAASNTRLFECNFPCDDIVLDIVSTSQSHTAHDDDDVSDVGDVSDYHISIHYQNVDTYKIMEEKAMYKLNQLVCEIGGIVSVIVGMSTMSLAEIFFYIVLKIAHKYV